jgi:hypothetical protein
LLQLAVNVVAACCQHLYPKSPDLAIIAAFVVVAHEYAEWIAVEGVAALDVFVLSAHTLTDTHTQTFIQA